MKITIIMCSCIITLDFRPLVVAVFYVGECSRNTKENIHRTNRAVEHEGAVEGITLSGQPRLHCKFPKMGNGEPVIFQKENKR